ncbi:WAS/WASL-interacting protein family member 1-like isoform X2 [Canna indica]|uniref:WAS/WASL-interacting protein family member 1-like isoform X2 n=1 Tax=Canna indica TaxID=4628 RepID=A0AAQ3JYD4_9LILI|nr:WAS/WASL-interacting protein family member 1-like isoform X2 [Canna indica]
MDESVKRRERLQAMRLEASHSAAHSQPSDLSPAPAVPPPTLPLPHLEDPQVFDSPPPVSRFDFYTDPTSAFSAAKRMRGATAAGFSSSSPNRSHPLPPPSFPTGIRNNYVDSSYPSVHQFHPDSRPYQTPPRGSYQTPRVPHDSPWRSPIQLPTPFSGNQGYPSLHQFHPDSGSYQTPSCVPHNRPWRSPIQLPAPFSGSQGSPASGPGSWDRSDGSRNGFPMYSSSSSLTSSHFGQGQSPMRNAGNGSPYPTSGRGRGRHFSGGSSPRPSGGRGQSFNYKASAKDDITRYYCKSMLEDPWRDLEPVIGNIMEPMAGPGSERKSNITETGSSSQFKSKSSSQFKSKSSLAEFLASSLEEAINDED